MDFVTLSLSGFDEFLLYAALSALFVGAYLALYLQITPYAELKLIKAGNTAAALSLSGALLGFTLPLASAVYNSVHPWDMMLWGAVAAAVQLVVYIVVRFTLIDVTRHIPEGQVGAGILLGAISLAAGILNAACMTY